MRRTNPGDLSGHQSLTHSLTPCVRKCVCKYRVVDVYLKAFLHVTSKARNTFFMLTIKRPEGGALVFNQSITRLCA